MFGSVFCGGFVLNFCVVRYCLVSCFLVGCWSGFVFVVLVFFAVCWCCVFVSLALLFWCVYFLVVLIVGSVCLAWLLCLG